MINQARLARMVALGFIALYVLMAPHDCCTMRNCSASCRSISWSILMGFRPRARDAPLRCKRFAVFFSHHLAISWSYETTSILTGFPFGHYVYADKLGPKLWLVPLLIMPAISRWANIAWTSTCSAGSIRRSTESAEVVLVPCWQASVMVDVGSLHRPGELRPSPAPGSARWRWLLRRALVNFLGWYLCVFTIYLVVLPGIAARAD